MWRRSMSPTICSAWSQRPRASRASTTLPCNRMPIVGMQAVALCGSDADVVELGSVVESAEEDEEIAEVDADPADDVAVVDRLGQPEGVVDARQHPFVAELCAVVADVGASVGLDAPLAELGGHLGRTLQSRVRSVVIATDRQPTGHADLQLGTLDARRFPWDHLQPPLDDRLHPGSAGSSTGSRRGRSAPSPPRGSRRPRRPPVDRARRRGRSSAPGRRLDQRSAAARAGRSRPIRPDRRPGPRCRGRGRSARWLRPALRSPRPPRPARMLARSASAGCTALKRRRAISPNRSGRRRSRAFAALPNSAIRSPGRSSSRKTSRTRS